MQQKKGKYTYKPVNEEKYTGKHLPQVRSSYEDSFCRWLDKNPEIIQWSSEEFAIPYYDPVRKKKRRYYPDFIFRARSDRVHLVEIKPYIQTIPPVKGRKSKKTYLREMATYNTNVAKWIAARAFCNRRGWEFNIVTEKDLYK